MKHKRNYYIFEDLPPYSYKDKNYNKIVTDCKDYLEKQYGTNFVLCIIYTE